MDHLPLGGRWRGFSPNSSVSSSITHRCIIFVFTSLFPYSLSFNVFVINFGLEYFTNLGLAYIHHSAHILFVYKLVLVSLIFGV